MRIVRAKPEDSATLTEIAFSAKRHWGYPEKWIELWHDLLTISSAFIANNETYLIVQADRIAGFYALTGNTDKMNLTHLWVLPAAMNHGLGRALFTHAINRTRELGCLKLEIESDPNAEGFYLHMGARRARVKTSKPDGQKRELPILVYEIPPMP